MGFYTSPSFFAMLAVAVVPAAVLGLLGRSIRGYGMMASVAFLAFLFSGSPAEFAAFALFLAAAGLAEFVTLRTFAHGGKSVPLYLFALALTLAPLVCCKAGGLFGHQNLLGFAGISYLTFKAVQVVIETRDGLIKAMSPLDWLYFVCFFPVFTSGPIDRSRRFVEDAHRHWTREEYADLLSRGLLLLLAGAVYQMVLATIAGGWYSPAAVGSGPALAEAAEQVKDAWAFGLFMFFNFAGYSMMAVGASYCFGIRTPRNFRAPFAAVDIKDFWNRWHITLSFWLRDFVFMRFVRSAARHKWFKSRLTGACMGYVVNMGLMGAWHGLTPEYLAYGLFHGVLLAATDAFQKKSSIYKRCKNELWFKALSWFVTVNLVMLGFAIFSGQVTVVLKGLGL